MKNKGVIKIVFVLFCMIVFIKTTSAQQSNEIIYYITNQSVLTINGTSTLHNFEVKAKEIKGTLSLDKNKADKSKISQLNVVVPVKKLDTDKSSMNDNMDKALKADKNPNITYTLKNINAVNLPDSANNSATLNTQGTLTIAGVSKDINMDVNGYQTSNGTLHFTGQEKINMVDYGVTPPTMFFGAIKVGKDVTVHFNLVLAPQNNVIGSK